MVLIEEPIDLAEGRLTPHPCTVIDLTEDDEETVLDSEGLVRDFMSEEEEQVSNEEEETIQVDINQAAVDPAPEYLPSGIDDPFFSK